MSNEVEDQYDDDYVDDTYGDGYIDGERDGIATVFSALERVKQPFIGRLLSGDTSDVVKGAMVALDSMQDEIDKLAAAAEDAE